MKRLLTLLPALAFCLLCAPAVFAETVTYLDETGQARTADATAVTENDTQWADGWYVAQGDVTLPGRVTVAGDVRLILADGADLTALGGIQLEGDNALTIYAQSDGDAMGALTATGTTGAAGIGGKGGNANDSGAVTIHGGAVTAIGGTGGAGIGAGSGGTGNIGDITIHGGTVTPTTPPAPVWPPC